MNHFNKFDFKKRLEDCGIRISDFQIEKFSRYIDLLLAWNKRTNLISKADEAFIIEKHVLESLSVLLICDIHPNSSILDIGSGAGFPALPISFIRPDLNFLLVESKRLKALFLKDVVDQLGLQNVEVICERVEKLSENLKWREYFDFALCRAVASLDVVYGWARDLIKPMGWFLAWKGGDVKIEIKKMWSEYQDVFIEERQLDRNLVSPERDKKIVLIQRKR